jgi:hypothetical protein|tara:strand:+ start:3881 stop:4351 length:471 start_codon:yes stop_codon:yes gene_type:complete
MELVDSNEKLLSGPEIVTRAAYNTPDLKYPVEAVLLALASEFSLPRTDLVQIGNTVFIGHVGKRKKISKKMVGRAFNVDTGRNFIVNGFKYFTYLQRKGITHYSTQFSGPVFLNGFKLFKRRLDQLDTEISIGKYRNSGKYVVFIRFGKQPLVRGL